MTVGAVLLIAALALLIFNRAENEAAEKTAEEILPAVIDAIEHPADSLSGSGAAETVSGNGAETDVVEVGGERYIGYLSLPALGLSLPVMSDCDDTRLKISPCRYSGSVQSNDLVIAGHNYTSHFGRLGSLEIGDQVVFTDAEGKAFSYTVAEMEQLGADDVEEMKNSVWDLTLFTCTVSGKARVTVRCKAAE